MLQLIKKLTSYINDYGERTFDKLVRKLLEKGNIIQVNTITTKTKDSVTFDQFEIIYPPLLSSEKAIIDYKAYYDSGINGRLTFTIPYK